MPSAPIPVSTTASTPLLPDTDGRLEQRIDRGLAEVDLRTIVERDHDVGPVLHHTHVLAAGGDVDLSGLDHFAIDGFMRRPLARARQVFGQNGRERRRHVLRDHHGKAVDHRPNVGDERHQRLRSAGGRADHQRAGRRGRERTPYHRRVGGRLRTSNRSTNRCSAGCRCRRQRRAVRRDLDAAAARAEVADLLHQIAAEGLGSRDLAGAFGLRDVVGRAERERLEADLRIAAGQRRRHDDDEVALLAEQQRQRGDAVEVGHLDIEHRDIGIDALDVFDRLASGAERSHDRHVGLGFDPARDQAADHGRIVDHHDAQTVTSRVDSAARRG